MDEHNDPISLAPGVRVIRCGHDPGNSPDGSANVIRLRPGRRVEILLDVEVAPPPADRIKVVREVDLIRVNPGLSHLSAEKRADRDTVQQYGAWYDLPYPAVPWNTSPGLVHKVVAIYGTVFTGWGMGTRVVGVTACGKGRTGNLELDRDNSGTFPQCKRCWKDG